MITLKVKQYTIHELETMHEALNIAQLLFAQITLTAKTV